MDVPPISVSPDDSLDRIPASLCRYRSGGCQISVYLRELAAEQWTRQVRCSHPHSDVLASRRNTAQHFMTEGITLREYDPAWEEEFSREHDRILGAMCGRCLAIEHVGSTSIRGMVAKPIIDIAAIVSSFDVVDEALVRSLATINYEYVPKPDLTLLRFFRRGEWGKGTLHLHVFEQGSTEWVRMLAFRDFLRLDADAHRRYAQLKRGLSAETRDRNRYTEAKGPFVREVLRRAGVLR